jgi:hypothetical protein
MKFFIPAVTTLILFITFVNVPASWFSTTNWFGGEQNLGAFTQLTSTNKLSDFPTTYNANLAKTIEVGTTSVASITTLNSLTSATSLATLSALTSIGTIDTGVWQGTAIDVSDYTNLAAGRSLTLSGDSVEADTELFTGGLVATLQATTTSDGIATTTELGTEYVIRAPVALTVTGFECYADQTTNTGTSTIRATSGSNPLTTGTDLLYTTGVQCGSQELVSTSTFSSTAISAGDYVRIYVSDAEPTGSRPAWINVNFTVTKDD